MEKKRSQPKKLNNDGMTLMEILVATIIFSMVSVVFLRSFVYAFQMNEQAKQRQYSMVLAQSLMESAKAYDVTVLDAQFSGADANFKVYALNDGAIKLAPSFSGDTRTYSMRNVVYQPARFGDRYKYDVDVVVTPSTDSRYKATLVKAQDVNAYGDAIYVEGDDEQYKLRDAIITGLMAEGHTGSISVLDTSKISAKRVVNVGISTDDKVTVQSVYEYSVNNYPITKTGGVAANASFSGTVAATDDAITCYDKSSLNSGVILQGLYLYYFPAYKNAANQLIACSSDEIKIINDSSTLENIYLLKQENPALSQAEIDASEGSYSPMVTIQDDATTGPEVRVFHNLSKQLHDSSLMVVPPPVFMASGSVNPSMKAPWEEKDGEPETTLLYNVTVTVYRSGSSEPICEIVGSTNAK